MKEDFYTVKELAKRYKVTPQTIIKNINEGKLRAVRVGGVWRIPSDAWDEFLQNSSKKKGRDLNEKK